MDNMCSCLEYIAHYTVKNFANWIFSDIHFTGKYSTKARSGIDFNGMIRAIRTTFKGDNCFTIRELPVFAVVSGLYKLSIK